MNKIVEETKAFYKQKIDHGGKVEKYYEYICRLVKRGFRQVEEMHYTETYSPTPATSSIRMLLKIAAAIDRKLR